MHKRLMKVGAGLGVALAALALLGCQGNTRDESEAPVFLLVYIQDGEALSVYANIREECSDVAQIILEHRLVGGGTVGPNPYTDAILRRVCVTYVNKRTGGNTAGYDVPYPFCREYSQPVETGSTLEIDNFAVLRPDQKRLPPLDRSTGMVFPMELTARLTAYGQTVDGEALQPSTLEMNLFVADEAPRVPPCPSQQ